MNHVNKYGAVEGKNMVVVVLNTHVVLYFLLYRTETSA